MARNKMFTVYDRMEEKGIFDANPANTSARDPVTGEGMYKGPVPYPKMLYSPKGETRIMVPAEVVNGPYGPERHGEQRQIISVIVNNAEEERKYLDKGWHTHPSDAIAAAGGEAPPKGSADRISQLEAQIAQLQREKAEVGTAIAPSTRPDPFAEAEA